MDPSQTLQEMSAKSLALRIFSDPDVLYTTDRKFPEVLSNLIYKELTDSPDSMSREVVDTVTLRLKLGDLSFKSCPLSKATINLVRFNEVKYFALGDAKQFEQEITRNTRNFILRVFEKGNRECLLEMDLSGRAGFKPDVNGQLSRNWNEIGKHFPSLHTLNISHRLFPDSDLENIAFYFSQITTLDISNTLIASLDGISVMKNLVTLIMKHLIFEQSEDISDIANLQNLKTLNVSFSQPSFVEHMMKEVIVLENLRFLDCSGTNTTVKEISYILETCQKLTKIALVQTLAQEHKFNAPGIEILSIATPHQAVNSLVYYTSENLESCVYTCIECLNPLLQYPIPDTRFDPEQCLKAICKTSKTFSIYDKWRPLATNALTALVKNYQDVIHPRHLYHACIKIEEMGGQLGDVKETVLKMWKNRID